MDHIQKHREEFNARVAASYNPPTSFEKAIQETVDNLEKGSDAIIGDLEKSEESDPIELRKSELEEEIGRLSHVIQSRINSDNGVNYITKGMQSDLTKSKRELAYIKQYGELSK